MDLFYVYIFVFLGFAGGATSLIAVWAAKPENIGLLPFWAYKSGRLLGSIMVIGDIVALGIVFYRYGISYVGISVLQICLGAFLLGFFSREFKYYIAFISPAILFWCLAPLLRFWYLSETMMIAFIAVIIGLYFFIKSKDNNKTENYKTRSIESQKLPNQNADIEFTKKTTTTEPNKSKSAEYIQLPTNKVESEPVRKISNKTPVIWMFLILAVIFSGIVYLVQPERSIYTDSQVAVDYPSSKQVKIKADSTISGGVELNGSNESPLALGQERVVVQQLEVNGILLPISTKIVLTAVEGKLVDFMFEINGEIYSERANYSIIRDSTK